MKKSAWLKAIFFFAVCLFSLKVQVLPAQASSSVGIEVCFVLDFPDNRMPIRLITPSAVEYYMGKSAKLIDPNGKELTDTITEENKEDRLTWRTEIDDNGEIYEGYEGRYYFKLADVDDLSNIVPGTYTLTEFECPRGYEIDEVRNAYENYSKSITFTQEDVEIWPNYFWFEEDGYVFTIFIPLKPEGTISNYYELPPKAELSTQDWCEVYRKKKYIGTIQLGVKENWTSQFWYAKKKNGKWKKLRSNGRYCDFSAYEELEHGKEYYFKARYGKYMDDRMVYGEFSDPVKIKVLKSIVTAYIPELKVTCSGKKQKLEFTADHDNDRTWSFYGMLYYSDKEDGEYQFIFGSHLGKTELSKIKELKKGKTWYLKARFCYVDGLWNNVIYGDFSKPIKIMVK